MKVLMVVQHVNFFRNLDTVLRELCRRGHEVVFLHGTRFEADKVQAKTKRSLKVIGRGLQVAQSEIPGVTTGYRPEPTETWQGALQLGRQILNRASYFRPAHPAPDRTVSGIEKELPADVVERVLKPLPRWLLGRRLALSVWRWIEAAVPPSATVQAAISEVNPDVMIVAPTIWPKKPVEADYFHAARSLGIPSIGYVNSWDNLTSKGTLHVLPDAFVVWNEPLAQEAVELHDVPQHTIRITGAPYLDMMFEMQPRQSHAEVCAVMGCPADRPYIVYLCSSRTLMEWEVPTVQTLAAALKREFPEATPTLVVRPHPTNAEPWEGQKMSGVVIYPRHGDQADCPEAWQEYYDQLALATCVFGLNTTAFLEAVIVDRPCFTIVAPAYHNAQGYTGHFRHLIKGGFLDVCGDAREFATRVRRLLSGHDDRQAGRKHFTEWFIRPAGLETPSTPIMCDLIESMARASVPATTGALVPALTFSAEGRIQ